MPGRVCPGCRQPPRHRSSDRSVRIIGAPKGNTAWLQVRPSGRRASPWVFYLCARRSTSTPRNNSPKPITRTAPRPDTPVNGKTAPAAAVPAAADPTPSYIRTSLDGTTYWWQFSCRQVRMLGKGPGDLMAEKTNGQGLDRSRLRAMELWNEVAGVGSAVTLIHPGVCDSRVWDPQWDTFARVHTTIRC